MPFRQPDRTFRSDIAVIVPFLRSKEIPDAIVVNVVHEIRREYAKKGKPVTPPELLEVLTTHELPFERPAEISEKS